MGAAGNIEPYSKFREPSLNLSPGCADKPPSGESIVGGHFRVNERRYRQRVSGSGRIELCFSQAEALQRAFENVDAERRHAIACLTDLFRGKLRQHAKLLRGEVHVRDPSLLRSVRAFRNFLGELEHGRETGFGLFAQAQSGASM